MAALAHHREDRYIRYMNKETCWTLIEAMRGGNTTARDDSVHRYLSPVRAYLQAR